MALYKAAKLRNSQSKVNRCWGWSNRGGLDGRKHVRQWPARVNAVGAAPRSSQADQMPADPQCVAEVPGNCADVGAPDSRF